MYLFSYFNYYQSFFFLIVLILPFVLIKILKMKKIVQVREDDARKCRVRNKTDAHDVLIVRDRDAWPHMEFT